MTGPAVAGDRLLSVAAVPGSTSGSATVEVDGEVDGYTAPLLEACLDAQLARPGLRMLVVDLERVGFLGSAGVAVLVRAQRRCVAQRTRLVLRSPREGIVRRALQITGAADLLQPAGRAARRPGQRARRAERRTAPERCGMLPLADRRQPRPEERPWPARSDPQGRTTG
jgi:anti-sigma B factor antagonist